MLHHIKSNAKTQLINSFHLTLTFDDEIKSANGQIKDKTVDWFQTDFSKENVLTATLKSSGSKSNSNEGGKGCGLFGMELPIILFGGLVLAFKKKKK